MEEKNSSENDSENYNFFPIKKTIVTPIDLKIPENFMNEDSLIVSYNAHQNSINVDFDIERVNVDIKIKTSKGLKPYKLEELKFYAKQLGIQFTGFNKPQIVMAIKEKHEILEKNNK